MKPPLGSYRNRAHREVTEICAMVHPDCIDYIYGFPHRPNIELRRTVSETYERLRDDFAGCL